MITVGTITDEQIRDLRDGACDCLVRPRVNSEGHVDCDECTYDLCCVALGDNPIRFPRSTALALQMQLDARASCAEILNARRSS